MSGEKLVQLFNQKQEPTETFHYGKVLSISPLKVQVNSKLTLDEDFLIVGRLCKETKASQDAHSHPTVGYTSNFVTLWRGLQVGDTVIMIRSNNGQKWYLQEIIDG